jgi:hypothetical protein
MLKGLIMPNGTDGLCEYMFMYFKKFILQHRKLMGDAKITTIEKQILKKYNS